MAIIARKALRHKRILSPVWLYRPWTGSSFLVAHLGLPVHAVRYKKPQQSLLRPIFEYWWRRGRAELALKQRLVVLVVLGLGDEWGGTGLPRGSRDSPPMYSLAFVPKASQIR